LSSIVLSNTQITGPRLVFSKQRRRNKQLNQTTDNIMEVKEAASNEQKMEVTSQNEQIEMEIQIENHRKSNIDDDIVTDLS
jgi:hypothetical protein